MLAVETPLAERVAECLAEVLTHGAVQHEIDGRVDEHEDVHDVAERLIYLFFERRQDTAEQVHDSLWELADEEHDDDRQ